MYTTLLLLLVAGGDGAAAPPQPAPDKPLSPADEQHSAWSFEFAPEDLLFEDYVADPRRPVFALTNINAYDSDLPQAGNSRTGIRLGARFGILRFTTPWTRTPLQLDGFIGFLGEFDRDNSTDNLGWDGLYGANLTWSPSQRVSLQLGFAHDSSHLGDEYVETTGRQRLNYTREELRLGARMKLRERLQVYGEVANAYTLRNQDEMDRGRVQAGVEWEGAPRLWGERLAPFLAVDAGAFEEDDWDPNFNVQAGFVRRPPGDSVWRFGLEFYDGRSPIGELFREDEQHFALGVWLDL